MVTEDYCSFEVAKLSLLEYGNADLWEDHNTNYNNYPMFYKYYFNCPVCKCEVEVEKIALKGD